MVTERALPPAFDECLQRLDLDGAYAVLSDSDHFYARAVMGLLRHTQVRLVEALELFEDAQARYRASLRTDRQGYLRLLGFRLSTCLLQEALGEPGEFSTRTDSALEDVLEFAGDEMISSRVRDKCLGMYYLVRGRHADALQVFENAIAGATRVPDRCIPSYICAAACAHELGLHKEARRHYENAELTMAFYNDRFVFATCLTWLLALCRSWGWDGEARRWADTIQAIDCPETTRDYLFQRARVLQRTSQVGTVAFA